MNLNTTAAKIRAPEITFSHHPACDAKEIYVIGYKASLLFKEGTVGGVTGAENEKIIGALLSSIKESGKASTFLYDGRKLTIIALPVAQKISRNNHPFSLHDITDSLEGLHSAAREHLVQIWVVDKQIKKFMCPVAAAIARALPLYHSKSNLKELAPSSGVVVTFAEDDGVIVNLNCQEWQTASAVCEGVRLAAQLGDMPPAELTPDTYAQKCQDIANGFAALGVTYTEIKGDDLRQKGYGGIMGVGMAARCPPRMVVMTYSPKNATEHIAMCGKGVVYDTGGLAIKPRPDMCSMKFDCGGSAGVLGGFVAAVTLGLPVKLTLILAIVENAIGPDSFRHDDILTMKSGKTVEVNNTDAEGRLILADCVSHASNQLGDVDLILNMATLTGAQCITTGSCHAGIMTRTKGLEDRVVEAGLKTGDLVFPMLYAPELLKKEFKSSVADMKNSVANRMNAQASCAGHFIESHIDEAFSGDWLHVDMAGPQSRSDGRATGYGVALVLGLCKAPGFC
jgi:probable aminopeptidase NPEPL1